MGMFFETYVVVVKILTLPLSFYLSFDLLVSEWKVFRWTISLMNFWWAASCFHCSYFPWLDTSKKLILVASTLLFYCRRFCGVWWIPKLKLINFGDSGIFLASSTLMVTYLLRWFLCVLHMGMRLWVGKLFWVFSLRLSSSSSSSSRISIVLFLFIGDILHLSRFFYFLFLIHSNNLVICFADKSC